MERSYGLIQDFKPFHILSAKQSSLIIHLHIPKCAGTTVNNILGNNFPGECYAFGNKMHDDEFNGMSKIERAERYKVVFGHLKYGIHKKFDIENYIYFSVLRDPIDRLCSLFNYIHLRKEHPLNSVFKEKLRNLNEISEEFIQTQRGMLGNFKNYMSSAFLGRRCNTVSDFEELKLHLDDLISDGKIKIGSFDYVKSQLLILTDNKNSSSTVNLNVTKDMLKDKSDIDFDVASVQDLNDSTYELLSKWNIFDIRIFENNIKNC